MANINLNKVIIAGRITADPELKQTNSGTPVTSFTVAINRRFKPKDGEAQADFINVTAWSKNAELLTSHFKKASSVCIVGSLQTRSWTDQQGQKRFATEVVADEVYFVDSKSESSAQPAPTPASQYVPEQYRQSAPQFKEVDPDSDLPF